MNVSNEGRRATNTPGVAFERPSDVLSANLRPAAIQTSLWVKMIMHLALKHSDRHTTQEF